MEQIGLSVRIERRWPLQVLLALALVWAVLAGLRIWPAAPLDLALALLPPMGLVAFALALLPVAAREVPLEDVEARLAAARAETQALNTSLDSLNTALDAAVRQTSALSAALASDSPALKAEAAALSATVATLETSAAAAHAAGSALSTSMPVLKSHVEAIGHGLAALGQDAGVQLRAVEAMLGRVQAQNADASAGADLALTALAAQVGRIEEASRQTTDAIAKRSYALDGAVDGVLMRASAAFDDIDKRLTELLGRLDHGLEGADSALIKVGEDGVRRFTQRFDTLLNTSRTLEAALAAHEQSASEIQARLNDGEQAASRMAAPMAALANSADKLASNTATSLSEAEAKLTKLAISTDAIRAVSVELDEGESRLVALAQALERQITDARDSLASLEAAASSATTMGEDSGHRLAEQAGIILGRVQAVDDRLDAIETRFVARERSTLARDAQRLMAGLSSEFGDLVELLNMPIPEAEWTAWLKGDRSALPASVKTLLGDDDQRRIARYFAHDPVFRASALRFLDGFEALITRLLGDREGDALAATMLSADYGKLYVRVGEAAGRVEG